MKRTFLRDAGRFKKGESRDYPKGVWANISESLKSSLDEFSISDEGMVKELITRDEPRRGPGRPRHSG